MVGSGSGTGRCNSDMVCESLYMQVSVYWSGPAVAAWMVEKPSVGAHSTDWVRLDAGQPMTIYITKYAKA